MGVQHPRAPTRNPLRLAFREWAIMLGDAWRAKGWRAKAKALFAAPGIAETL